MFFILQNTDEIEIFQMKQILKESHQDSYILTNNFDNIKLEELKNSVPVGDLDFIKSFLNIVYGSSKMPPIEIPVSLRNTDITKRHYDIVNGKVVPNSGRYFIKDASELKQFSFNGDISYIQDLINVNHKYVLSSIVDIASEYRVIVLNDKIQGIQYYDGSPIILPDSKFIQSIVNRYMLDSTRPESYIADFGVNLNNETFLIELQPSVSFGTYGYFSKNLKYVYKFGLDYYININKYNSK